MEKKIIVLLIVSITCTFAFSQPANCSSPIAQSSPFTVDGVGEFCFELSCIGSNINSWNTDTIEINGIDYTNKYCDGIYNCGPWPSRINGKYYIHYKGSFAWSHFEMNGSCNGVTSTPTESVLTPTPSDITTVTPTAEPTPAIVTPELTAETTLMPTPLCACSNIWMSPSSYTTSDIINFTTEVHANTGTSSVGAVGINISYDPAIIGIDTTIGSSGVQGLSSSLNLIVNSTPGLLKVAGFSTTGVPGSYDLALIKINFIIIGGGTEGQSTNIGISVLDFTDINGNELFMGEGMGAVVTIGPGLPTPETVTPEITIEATPTPAPTPCACENAIWLSPSSYTTTDIVNFTIDLYADTGSTSIGAFGFDITYDPAIIGIYSSVGTSGVQEIASGLNLTVNSTPGLLKIAGFNAAGISASSTLALIRLNFIHIGGTEGQSTTIRVGLITLADITGSPIQVTQLNSTTVIIGPGLPTPAPSPEIITPAPTDAPTVAPPTQGPTPVCAGCVGSVWITPETLTTTDDAYYRFIIHANTDTYNFGIYTFNFYYDPTIWTLDFNSTGFAVETLDPLFPPTVNQGTGMFIVASFCAAGVQGTADYPLLAINLMRIGGTVGQTTDLRIEVVYLNDLNGNTIFSGPGTGSTITLGTVLTSPAPRPTLEPTAVTTAAITGVPTMPPPVPTPTASTTATITPAESPSPEPVNPTPIIITDYFPEIMITPANQSVTNGTTNIKITVHVLGMGPLSLGAYGITLTYDAATLGSPVVAADSPGFVSASNANIPGKISVVGFDATGIQPGNDVALFYVTFTAIGTGTSRIDIAVNTFVDPTTNSIALRGGIYGGTITIN